MLGLNRNRLLGGLAAIFCIAGLVWLVLDHFVPAPPKIITIAAGSKGGAYEFYARQYRDILARNHVTLDIRSTEGTVENLRLLQDPSSGVSVGFVQGGVSNSTQAPGLESLGRINYLAFFILGLPGIEWVIGEIIAREKLVDSGLSAL
ncbi:MAG: hypothetical protein EXR12_08945 [Rhodospirillaceae bacterium]|nr:hypothetical protein [Rhodospirillaceae bacterium]